MYGDAEEAADRVEEVRHGGAAQRAATLEAVNADLRKQLEFAQERKQQAAEHLQRIKNPSLQGQGRWVPIDPHDLT